MLSTDFVLLSTVPLMRSISDFSGEGQYFRDAVGFSKLHLVFCTDRKMKKGIMPLRPSDQGITLPVVRSFCFGFSRR